MTIGRNEELPPLPEPEGTHLRNHLKQVCSGRGYTCYMSSDKKLVHGIKLNLLIFIIKKEFFKRVA